MTLPSDAHAEQARLSDMKASAQAPKGFIQAFQSANIGLKKPRNEMFQVEKSKSIQNRNKAN